MNKRIIFSFALLLTIFASSLGASFALFSSKAEIHGISFSTGYWGSPDAPQLKSPQDDFRTNKNLIFEWYPSTQVFFEPETYALEIYDVDPLVIPTALPHIFQENINDFSYGEIDLNDGEYFWRVKAVDARGQSSSWSELRRLTVDKSAPQTKIYVENSPKVLINEQIPAGNFEKYENTDDLQEDYATRGDVALWKSDDSYLGAAHEGNKMLRIGALQNNKEGNNYLNNSFSLSFPNSSKTISFYYNFFSVDEYPFDDPGFLLELNGKEVLKLNTLDIKNNESTGWKQFSYDISDLEGDITLNFFAGNNFDNFRQSWIYIDQISTGRVAVNDKAKFTLEVKDEESVTSYYCIDDCGSEEKYIVYSEPFSLNLSNGEHDIHFYSKDTIGNLETPQVKLIFFDKSPPRKISDLRVKNLLENSAILTFTAPNQDNSDFSGKVTGYEGEISDEFADGALISPRKFDLNINPQESGSLEEFSVLNLLPNKSYFVAIKSFDAPKNYSEISNFVEINIPPSRAPSPSSTPTPSPTLTPTSSPSPTPTIELINLIQNGDFENNSTSPWESRWLESYSISQPLVTQA